MRVRRVGARGVAVAVCIGAVLAALVGVAPAPVRAATMYIVGSTADTTGASAAMCQMAMNTTCTLRDAVGYANAGAGGDTITFNLAAGSAITLTSAELALTQSVTITGPTGGTITVQRSAAGGTTNFRIFSVAANKIVGISNLTVSGGNVGGDGGGIFNSGTITLTNSTVSGNTASSGGGSILNFGTATLTNSTVSGNTASSGGGGILNGSTVTQTNSTVSGNTAGGGGPGGGILNFGTATLTNSTVSGNTDGGGGGGGVYNAGRLNATNTIIAGNTNNDNLFGSVDGTNTANFTSGNPQLASLGNYGGPTQTQPPFGSSPAVDMGNAAACAATPVNGRDQRGVPRPQGAGCDIGAVERFTGAAAITVDSTGDGAADAIRCVDAIAGNCTLRDAIAATSDGGTITFDATVFPPVGTAKTITLTQGQLTITQNVTITGPGSNRLTVDGNTADRVLQIDGRQPAASPPPPAPRTIGPRVAGATATISGITFTNGNLEGSGGGIAVFGSGGLIGNDLVISNNNASTGGGIFLDSSLGGSTLTLTNSTISGNTSSDGGGIYNMGPGASLTNVTISGNRTFGGNGGAIVNGDSDSSNATMTLLNVTISNNTTTTGSGAVSTQATATLNATNTIIAGNTGGDLSGTLTTNTNNLTSGSPLLAPLALYGGTKQTQPPLPGSTAIDTGTNAGCPVTDERGAARPANGTCDKGAVESQGFTLKITSGNNQMVLPNAAFMPLVVQVTGNFVDNTMTTREPVIGGTVTYTPPIMGASATLTTSPATIMAGGTASVNAQANGTAGPLAVPVTTAGVTMGVTFNLTIFAPNASPTLAALMPVTVLEDSGASMVTLAGITAGAGDTGQTLTVTATSDTPTVVPNPTITYTSPNSTGSLIFTPVADAFGAATITVTVMDSGGTANGGVNTTSRTFLITVTPVNDAPTLDAITNRTVAINSGAQTVPLAGITVGPTNEAGQTLMVAATSNNTALIPNPTVTYTSANATGSLAFTPVTGQSGMATITVTVTDNGGTTNNGVNTTSRTFTVTVNPATLTGVTLAPTGGIVTGGRAMVPAGGTVQFTPTATFSDGSMRAVTGTNWMISDPMKGMVDMNGRVTTFASGTVQITTTYMGLTGIFTLVITPPNTGGLVPNPAPVARPDVAPPSVPAMATPNAAPGGRVGAPATLPALPAPPAPPRR